MDLVINSAIISAMRIPNTPIAYNPLRLILSVVVIHGTFLNPSVDVN